MSYDQLATLLWNSPLYLSSHSFLCNLHSLIISHSSFLKSRVNIVYLSLACMFNLFVFLYLKWTIYKQHMAESLIFFSILPVSVFKLGCYKTIDFNMTPDTVLFKTAILLLFICPNSACYPMCGNCCFP